MKLLMLFSMVIVAGCAHEKAIVWDGGNAPAESAVAPISQAPLTPAVSPKETGSKAAPGTDMAVRAEELRTDCVNGRRLICGRVLRVDPDGLVVDSGYKDLLREPLTHSWVVPGTAVASRDPTVLELNEPGTPCIGLVFLTDLPKRPKPNYYDYVVITGYPAGEYAYSPAPDIEKTIRKFSAGLETAVRLRLQSKEGSH